MKTTLLCTLFALTVSVCNAQHVTVQKIQGEVRVRHGVMEQWAGVAVGDVLKPDDSMKTGPGGSAVVVALQPGGQKRITLPPDVIVDISDIRDLTSEELMLKLAMERVRGSSYKATEDPLVPNASVVHGANKADQSASPVNDRAGIPEWNGARVLFDNGFFSTCALRGMELLRRFPSTRNTFDCQFLVAQSMERANLRGEAANEYATILGMPSITSGQQSLVKTRLNALQSR